MPGAGVLGHVIQSLFADIKDFELYGIINVGFFTVGLQAAFDTVIVPEGFQEILELPQQRSVGTSGTQ